MARQITEQEMNFIAEAEKQLRAQGKYLIVADEDDQKDVAYNAERVVAFFDANPSVPITVQTALDMFKQMEPQLRFKSAAEAEYNAQYAALTQAQKDAFGQFWYTPSTKRTIVITGDEGYSNAAAILKWARGRAFTDATFNLAVSNLAGAGKLTLVQQSTFRPSQHSNSGDTSFMKKSETNLTARDHAAQRAADADAAAGRQPQQTPATDYKKLAESIQIGRTHSDSIRLQKLFVMRPGTTDIDWQATASARQRLADGKAR